MKKRLIGLALIAGAVAAAAKLMATKKAEWQDLSESEARQKVEERLPSRVPEEKRAAVADKVVTKMRERGVLREEPAEPVSDVDSEAAETDVQDEVGSRKRRLQRAKKASLRDHRPRRLCCAESVARRFSLSGWVTWPAFGPQEVANRPQTATSVEH